MRRIIAITIVVAVIIASMITGYAGSDERSLPEKRVGVLLVGFGEPERYNADAFVGWKNFLNNYMTSGMTMMRMGFIYPVAQDMIGMVDLGTLLVDEETPIHTERGTDNLVDAWVTPYEGRARYIEIPEVEIPMLGPGISFYISSGKNGESDIWEYSNLIMYGLYKEYMNDHNPGEERELRVMDKVETELRAEYPDIVVRRGFGAARPGFEDYRIAAERLIEENDLTDLVIAPCYVCYSEFENPAGEIKKYIEERGIKINIVIADQIGGTTSYSQGVAKKVEEELTGRFEEIPIDSDVVILLSHHGMFNLNMLLYDWHDEPYHEYARRTFESAKDEVEKIEVIRNWEGDVAIWQVYTEFADGMMDPSNGFMSVDEAAERAAELGYDYCIDVPYEVGDSGYETLVGLREAWGIEPPLLWEDYFEDGLQKYRSTTDYKGMRVIITDGWIDGKDDGYLYRIEEVIKSL